MSSSLFEQMAGKYLWWSPPGKARHDPRRVIAQVLELGTHEDAEALREVVGDEVLKVRAIPPVRIVSKQLALTA